MLVDWQTKELSRLHKEMADAVGVELEIPKIPDGVVEQIIDSLVVMNPRFLYEFFDEQGVMIEIVPSLGSFYYYLEKEDSSTSYATRQEAENHAFTDALIKLREKYDNSN